MVFLKIYVGDELRATDGEEARECWDQLKTGSCFNIEIQNNVSLINMNLEFQRKQSAVFSPSSGKHLRSKRTNSQNNISRTR